jgi:hypothetical protein
MGGFMTEKQQQKEEERRAATKEAALEKAKKVHDEYEERIDELKQRRVLVDRECGSQVKVSNDAVVENNAEIVRLNTLLEKADAKEIKLSIKEKNEMRKQLKERRANQESLMYEAFDLQDEYKEVMQQITDEIKALREEQSEKEIRAKYSGQYLKDCIQIILNNAVKPYCMKDITDNHCDLRKIDAQKISIVLNQMVLNGEVTVQENEKGEKYYEIPRVHEVQEAPVPDEQPAQ